MARSPKNMALMTIFLTSWTASPKRYKTQDSTNSNKMLNRSAVKNPKNSKLKKKKKKKKKDTVNS